MSYLLTVCLPPISGWQWKPLTSRWNITWCCSCYHLRLSRSKTWKTSLRFAPLPFPSPNHPLVNSLSLSVFSELHISETTLEDCFILFASLSTSFTKLGDPSSPPQPTTCTQQNLKHDPYLLGGLSSFLAPRILPESAIRGRLCFNNSRQLAVFIKVAILTF